MLEGVGSMFFSILNMGQRLWGVKAPLGLFRGIKAPRESQITVEWRVDKGLFCGVDSDAMLSVWFQVSFCLEITDEAPLVEVSRYPGSFPGSFLFLRV